MITIEEFRNLSEEEKTNRYNELSDHDRYVWRVTSPLTPTNVKNSELNAEQRENATRIRLRLLKEGKITQEQFNELEKD